MDQRIENFFVTECPSIYRELCESRRLEILEFISLWRDQSGGICSNIEDTVMQQVVGEMTQRFPEFDQGQSREFVEWFCTQVRKLQFHGNLHNRLKTYFSSDKHLVFELV